MEEMYDKKLRATRKKLEFFLRSRFDKILATHNQPIGSAGKGFCLRLLTTEKANIKKFAFSYLLRIVDSVRTVIHQQNEYVYIPDLRNYSNK